MDKYFGLKDRVAIITGPAKGMGEAATLTLADAGADLVLVGRDLAPIENVAKKVRNLDRRAEVIQCDVTKHDQVVKVCEDTLKNFMLKAVSPDK